MIYMKKLFASDFDNTIYFHGETPPIREETVDAIKRFQTAGNLFGICTGRPARGLSAYFDGLFRPDFVIGSSGGMILDREGRTILEQTLPFDVLREIEEMGRIAGFAGAVHADGKFLLLDTAESLFKNMPRIRSLTEIECRPVYGISFLTESNRIAEQFAESVRARFSGSVGVWQNRTAIDINAAGCSKGTALRKITEFLHADRSYGMGDSLNDLPLLSGADMGFTFRTAPEALRRKAGRLADSAAEAILYALREQP